VLVTKGDHVERGQTIALVGNTGRSSAPHLHYEILKEGKNVDPMEYIIRGQN
jgi:murein DD-endopeptidase MepM/ murein hydrolase activator NlpD